MNKFFSFLILMALLTGEAHACSCLAVPEQQKYQDASDVFIGTVVETKMFTRTEQIGELEISTEQIAAKIKITKAIKGKQNEYIELTDGVADGANCAVGMLTGRDYLFYLSGDRELSICSGTRLYNEFTDAEIVEKMLSY